MGSTSVTAGERGGMSSDRSYDLGMWSDKHWANVREDGRNMSDSKRDDKPSEMTPPPSEPTTGAERAMEHIERQRVYIEALELVVRIVQEYPYSSRVAKAIKRAEGVRA